MWQLRTACLPHNVAGVLAMEVYDKDIYSVENSNNNRHLYLLEFISY